VGNAGLGENNRGLQPAKHFFFLSRNNCFFDVQLAFVRKSSCVLVQTNDWLINEIVLENYSTNRIVVSEWLVGGNDLLS
jgi:hypothetical protein